MAIAASRICCRRLHQLSAIIRSPVFFFDSRWTIGARSINWLLFLLQSFGEGEASSQQLQLQGSEKFIFRDNLRVHIIEDM
ncbi:hypothetical protein M758_12G072400 [Ceratodon purpureus]|nr:hypothetical protein M758_12G072400 [Ceratodon purpureus]